MKQTTKVLLSAVLTIALCLSVISGATFALFTSEASTNIAVTAGKVEVTAVIDKDSLKLYSMKEAQTDNFENGGTAKIEAVAGVDTLTLTNVTPGDGVTFEIDVTNYSNVAIMYRLTWVIDGKLSEVLTATVDGETIKNNTTEWDDWAVPADTTAGETQTMKVAIELPVEANDDYQEQTASINFKVEAVQANGTDLYGKTIVSDLEGLQSALANTNDTNEIAVTETIVIPQGETVSLDLNGKTVSGNFAKGEGAVLTNNGTLTITNGTIASATVNGDYAIQNEGTLTLDGATVVGAPIGDSGYPNYAIYSSGDLTIEDGTNVSSDRGTLKLQGAGTTTINGGAFTVNDINRTLTSHVVYIEEGSTNELTINGGTFQHLDAETSGGVVINNWSKGTVYVNGGNFSGGNYYSESNLSTYGFGGKFVVTGGTYTHFNKAFLATGYKAVAIGNNWVVVANDTPVVSGGTDTTANSTALDNAIQDAVQNGTNTVVLGSGNYIIPDSAQGKTLTIIGNGDTAVATQDDGSYEGCDYSLDGATVTFENITITTDSSTYTGYARLNATYNNCVINGTYTLYDDSVFNNCTFNVSGDVYNIWTWGAPEATFNDCTFNSDGKAILLYGGTATKLTVNNCVFNDKGGLADKKAAIETGNDYNVKKELIVNNTVVNGYEINDKGIVTGTTLWANKNSMGQDLLNVVVDGVDVY